MQIFFGEFSQNMTANAFSGTGAPDDRV